MQLEINCFIVQHSGSNKMKEPASCVPFVGDFSGLGGTCLTGFGNSHATERLPTSLVVILAFPATFLAPVSSSLDVGSSGFILDLK